MNALIIADVQNDFCPGGALAVPNGDEVAAVVNRLMPRFDLVVAMQDWHPAGHCSFATSHPGHRPGDVVEIDGLEQILWPEHCVQGSAGAAFHPDLNLDGIHEIVQKGTNPHIDSYSGFFDNARLRSTRLHHLLQARGVDHVTVTGLATDYCVKYTVLDALDLGYGTTVLADACRGVELRPGDVAEALREMRAAGAQVIHSS